MAGDATVFSHPERLTALQRQLIVAFLPRAPLFFLTGGAALSGFDFGHRATDDLDFFAPPGASLDEAEHTLTDAALELKASVSPLSRHADFRRHLVQRGDERCVVDLVLDRAPVLDAEKRNLGGVHVDTRREMTANKVAALVGRNELRDLVDLQRLLEAGTSLAQALEDAERKDAGVDPATLAWTLDQLGIGPHAKLPAGASPTALNAFRLQLIEAARTLALKRARGEPAGR